MRFVAVVAACLCLVPASASYVPQPFPLTWAPPTLVDPVTIEVTNENRRLFLDDQRDYRLVIAAPLERELWIEGGRNVVVVGGHVRIDEWGSSTPYQDNTAVKVRFGNPLGVVHLEGLLIDGARVADAIGLATSRAVQIQNVRVEGTYEIKGAHPDCIQTQRGVGALRVDRFSCRTQLQGIFLKIEGGERVGTCEIRNTNILGEPGKHLFFQASADIPVILDNLWLHTDRPWAPFGYQVFPQQDGRTAAGTRSRQRRAVVSRDGSRLWFIGSNIRGVVRKGRPGAGDFVSSADVGSAYQSPGYAVPVRGSQSRRSSRS
jgi:hypothetical protein